MDAWSWLLVVEYALLGIAGVYVLIDRARQRAAMRRLALYVFTRHPVVSMQPPTNISVAGPDEWIVLPPR